MKSKELVCRVCGSMAQHIWSTKLLRHDVAYYECPQCAYIQTEEPHWLEEAYSSAINSSDTGILARNQFCMEGTLITLWILGGKHGRVIDVAGGYGVLVRMLRDVGVDALWSDKYAQNQLARGFEDDGQHAFLATSFESFEHFVQPMEELNALLESADSLLISTEFAPEPTPAAKDWWYYGLDHGQHIGFFRRRTLEWMAARHSMRLLSDGRSFHLFTRASVNEFLWNQLIKRRKRFLKMARKGLKSRTWSDYEMLAKPDQQGAG
ncbi:MAG: class I SAM-dependent methyltransferase [Aquabacterium sp.]|uniref:class I SAM-dependent methyltransferase n=1 Tax=Aquabacterium sp. TaxID=1872578 RepID=UPI0027274329|nr:class I SAM-dependent methyltransferase [Aquabacterium sp.]MDO9006021.1 class I SAM-dependent methyltransferase [Aquabacterium sp.]